MLSRCVRGSPLPVPVTADARDTSGEEQGLFRGACEHRAPWEVQCVDSTCVKNQGVAPEGTGKFEVLGGWADR